MNTEIAHFFKDEARLDLAFKYEDPDFARRMLNEHFDQSTNNASRKQSVIASETRLISLLLRKSNLRTVLDIGCGPGIHIEKLNASGFECDGVDISPLAIEEAKRRNPQSNFYCCSLEGIESRKEYDAVTVLYGLLSELNNLSLSLASIKRCMRQNGLLIIELMRPEYIENLASQPLGLSQRESPSCFSDYPHIRVTKRFRDTKENCLVNRSLVIDNSGNLRVNESHFYSYSFEQMKDCLEELGFTSIEQVKTGNLADNLSPDYYYISARKGEL